jgi:hypothetical protein
MKSTWNAKTTKIGMELGKKTFGSYRIEETG